MKQLKANNYNQALKEVTALDPSLVEALKEGEINECDRKLYHIMTVTIESRAGQIKNDVNTNIVKLHKHGFERLAKNYVFQGISKLVVLHDPSQLDEVEKPFVPLHQKESIEAKVKRELKAKHDAEIAEAVQNAIEDANKPKTEEKASTTEETEEAEDGNPDEMVEIYNEVMENGKKADFLAFGLEYGIDGIEDAKDNDARKALLKTWFEQKV